MLISYNQNYEKIAMGLLSYITDFNSMERLRSEMESYVTEENKKLYLWRSQSSDNIIAVIGVEWSDSVVLVRHISVNPSFRNEGLLYKILDKLQILYPEHAINGTLETTVFVSKWIQKNKNNSVEGDVE